MYCRFLDLFVFTIIVLLFGACEPDRLDGKAIKEKMAERRLYHITEVQLLSGAETLGKRVVAQMDSAQKMASDSTGVSCQQALAPLLSVLEKNEIKASRLAFATWHPGKDTPKVTQVLAALKYTHDQGQSIPSNLQKDGNSGFQYVEGIMVSSQKCLSCHKDYALGQQVGIFNIRFGSRPAVKEASKGMKGMN